ncbi:hypothetical protein [Paenibacillus planticolens]|uniref:Lipoprotein n=1 Tax=Paenibacillus planticolens TaxID=2654976 RepID=A0ABX1ZHU1_9BACL|nr:hypothetical protein [Paenibacillus planticolens]NOU98624.1 hypothetical protein [Paenibacillus planticolens]
MIKSSILISLILVIFFCSACNSRGERETLKRLNTNDLHQITNTKDKDNFIDLTFQITSFETKGNTQYYVIKGMYDQTTVGLKVTINNTKEAGFNKGGIELSQIGEESNNFIRALRELYGEQISSVQMKDEVKFTDFVLESTSDYRKYKLFFESGEEDEYAEIYLNINLKDNLIEINEKDFEYREPILKALSL